jgi:hypothetical protein
MTNDVSVIDVCLASKYEVIADLGGRRNVKFNLQNPVSLSDDKCGSEGTIFSG